MFVDLLVEAAEEVRVGSRELEGAFAALECNFKRLLAAISEAYVSEELAPVREELARRSFGHLAFVVSAADVATQVIEELHHCYDHEPNGSRGANGGDDDLRVHLPPMLEDQSS